MRTDGARRGRSARGHEPGRRRRGQQPVHEDYDRGEKLRHYTHIPSLRAVLIVSHREARLTLHRRGAGSWDVVDARAGDTILLAAFPGSLAVDDVYRDALEDADPAP